MTLRFRALAVGLAVIVAVTVAYRVHEAGELRTLTVAAGSSGGEGFRIAHAIADVVERYAPAYRMIVLETSGSSQNLELLGDRRVDLALSQSNLAPPPTARLVASLYPEAFQVVARAGTDIEDVADLRGKRIALPPRGSGGYDTFWLVASHYGMTGGDFEALPMSTTAADFAMLASAVDAVFRVRAPGNASIRGLIANSPSYLVPLDQAAALRLKSPAVDAGTIPKGAYRGDPPLPPTDLVTATVQLLLLADEDTDDTAVGALTRVLFERRRDLATRTPLAGFITAPDALAGTFTPLHPGSQRYYERDRPSFIQQNAEPLALFLTIVLLIGSGLLQLRSLRKRRRIDQYNNELLELYLEARDLDDSVALDGHRDRLMTILGRVVDDAEERRITEEGFNLFSFTWTAVDERFNELLQSRRSQGVEDG